MKATWEEYVAIADDPASEKARCYYDTEWMRIEMAALGPLQARENSIVSKTISLFATFQSIRIVELTNASFYKPDRLECQPDVAFYIGPTVQLKRSQTEDDGAINRWLLATFQT